MMGIIMTTEAKLSPREVATKAREALVDKRRQAAGELVMYAPTTASMDALILIDRAIQAIDRAVDEETRIYKKTALSDALKNLPNPGGRGNRLA
jgi:hypothetical protein